MDVNTQLTIRFLNSIEAAIAKADGKGKDFVRLPLDDARMLLDLASREAAFEGELAAAATKGP